MKKLIRVTTVPISLKILLRGQLRFMSNYFEIIGISSHGKELTDVETDEGIKTQSINMTRAITPFKDLIALRKLYNFFKREKPFIVHSHTPKAGTLSMVAARMAGIKHRIHTVAGLPLLETTKRKRKLLNFVERITYASATKVLVNSENLRTIIIKEKLAPENKLKVIGYGSSNGIDTDYFNSYEVSHKQKEQILHKLNINKDDFVFIYIGRLVSDKGINETIEAFNNFSRKHKQTKLLLLGNRENQLNPLSSTTEITITENEQIISVGFVNDVRPYLAISKVLVLASYREGFPNVVLQAGAMKKASIVSDINGCNEIVTHNETGVIVPVKNSIALEKAMLLCFDRPERCDEYGRNARKRIEEKYSQTFIWNEYLRFYRTLQ